MVLHQHNSSGLLETGETIYQGEIINLGIKDIAEILDLQTEILQDLEKQELSVPISEDELEFIMSGHGQCVGFVKDGRLLAACAILYDVDDSINMAMELGFNSSKRSQVMQLEMALVHKSTRGFKLQHKLAAILVEQAKGKQDKRYLLSTVSPINYPSVQTVTRLGLYIVKLTRMYNDWDRYVVYRDLLEPLNIDEQSAVHVAVEDFSRQQQLLSAGYVGISQERIDGNAQIIFAKIIGMELPNTLPDQ
jgi:hypothetical protein